MGLFGFGRRRNVDSFFVCSYGSKQTRGIVTFEIDLDKGELIYRKLFKTPTDPVFAFRYGRMACITYKNRTGTDLDGGVCSYAMAAPGALALASRVSDYGKTYIHGCPHEDNTETPRMYFADYYNGEIVAIKALKKKMTRVLGSYQFEGHGAHPTRQALPHPRYMDFVPDRSRLFVVDLGLDQVSFFDVSNPDDVFQLDEEHTLHVEPGSGPKKMMFNRAGNRAYILNELTNTIMVYKYENLTFELIQTISTLPDEDNVNPNSLAGQMIFNDTEKYMFVTNCGDDSVVLLEVNETDGTLTYLDFIDTSGDPADIVIYNDKWIVVACQKDNLLESYELVHGRRTTMIETGYTYNVSAPAMICKFRKVHEAFEIDKQTEEE